MRKGKCSRTSGWVAAASLTLCISGGAWSGTPTLEIVDHSPYTGPQVSSGNSAYRPYDTRNNLAFQGNGFAKPAVAYNTIVGWSIHKAWFANDGNYGNGRSWIGIWDGANYRDTTWVKVDLGRTALIGEIRFGETRLQCYLDDRTAQTFKIEVATHDAVYAEGDETNDDVEYTEIARSDELGYKPETMGGCTTMSVRFDPVEARFVKISVTRNGTRIDEIEVFEPPAAVPVAVTHLPDINDNGTSELAVLAVAPGDIASVSVRDSETKEWISEVVFQSQGRTPVGLAGVVDAGGNPAIAVLFRKPNGQGIVRLRDALTGAWIRQMYFFGDAWEVEAITSQDSDMDGVSEIAVLGNADDGSRSAIQIRDAETGEPFNWIELPVE